MTCLLDQLIYFVLLNTRKTREIAHVTHTYDVVVLCIYHVPVRTVSRILMQQ